MQGNGIRYGRRVLPQSIKQGHQHRDDQPHRLRLLASSEPYQERRKTLARSLQQLSATQAPMAKARANLVKATNLKSTLLRNDLARFAALHSRSPRTWI